MPDSIGEKIDIYAETYKEDKVFNSKISNEGVGISFGNLCENSLHDSFQDKFDNVKGNAQFGNPSYDE